MASTLHNPQDSANRHIPGAQQPLRFDGPAYEPARDQSRLSGQMLRVYEVMKDGQWRSLQQIWIAIGGHASIPGISARLRDLRKPRFGSHTVNRRHIENGLFEYSLEVQQ